MSTIIDSLIGLPPWLGRRYGNRLVDHLPGMVNRSGGLDRALFLVQRRGAMAVALGRWVAVLRALVPGAAGTSGMKQGTFTVANVLGGTVWATTIAVAGYVAGASYQSMAKNLGLAGDVIAAALILAALGWWAMSHLRSRGST